MELLVSLQEVYYDKNKYISIKILSIYLDMRKEIDKFLSHDLLGWIH